MQDDVNSLVYRGIRALAVAKTDDKGEWHLLGLLTFKDPPREDTRETLRLCEQNGVEVKMVTGDHLLVAKEVARVLGMGTMIRDSTGLPRLTKEGRKPKDLKRYRDLIEPADGFAQVYPEHKYLIVECLRKLGYKVRRVVCRQVGRRSSKGRFGLCYDRFYRAILSLMRGKLYLPRPTSSQG